MNATIGVTGQLVEMTPQPDARSFAWESPELGELTIAIRDLEWLWYMHERAPWTSSRLSRSDRQLRYAARCTRCRKPATNGLELQQRGDAARLLGDCSACWGDYKQAGIWERGFNARRRLVRRNIPRGDLQQCLLKWVRDTEQDRADRTWRRPPPSPPGPPTGGGRRLRVLTWFSDEALSERKDRAA